MTLLNRTIDLLDSPAPPPAGGWLNDLSPEAFAALDEHGEVSVIGYRGEWYVPVKPSLRGRLRNWLVGIENRRRANDPRYN